MSRELKLSIGQHSDKGRKQANQDFYGVADSGGTDPQPEGYRHRSGRWHLQQQLRPGRERICGQGIFDGLLLHIGVMVGQNLGAAGYRRHQFLAARADAPKPESLRQGQGLCVHPERDDRQIHHGTHLPCRRFPRLSPRRTFAGAAHQRSSGRDLVGADLSRPRARDEPADRNRLPGRSRRKGRHIHSGNRRRL